MKRLVTLLVFCLLISISSVAAAGGTITGTVPLPNTERGMHIGRGEGGAAMMWDMSAPKNRKRSERAEIWLIERGINFTAIPYAAVQKWYQEGTIPANQPIYHAKVNEQGQFTFQNVPAAEYYVMILDPNGKEGNQNLADKMTKDELTKKLPHADEFELFMVGMRSCLVQKVSLRNGQTINIRPGVF